MNLGDLHILSREEAKRLTESFGFSSVEEFKEDYVSSGDVKHCDLYYDKYTGEIYVMRKGDSYPNPTGFKK